MNREQRSLLISGVILTIVSALYIASSSVPNSSTSAVLFPLSILGLLFGIVLILWSLGWMVFGKFLK